jgi:hypothetical protein
MAALTVNVMADLSAAASAASMVDMKAAVSAA